MSAIGAAFATEFLKARRSRVPWAIAAGFSIAPLVSGLFMVILKDPEAARSLGLLGAKAQLAAGTADWPTFRMLAQAVAVGGVRCSSPSSPPGSSVASSATGRCEACWRSRRRAGRS